MLGERDSVIPQSELVDFDVKSPWLATLEKAWDRGQVLSLWTLKVDQKYVCNTRINEPHSEDVTFLKFVPAFKNLRNLLITGGKDKLAKIWYLHAEGNSWQLLKTVNYLGLVPSAATSSQDGTVLALAFENAVVLYDTKTFQVLATLSSKHVKSSYTCLVFGLGSNARSLFGSTKSGIFAWDLLSLKLKGQFQSENSMLFSDSKSILMKSKDGIFAWDPSMKCTKLSSTASANEIGAFALDDANNRLYFVDHSSSKCNALKYLSLKTMNKAKTTAKIEDTQVIASSLEFNLNTLSVTVSEEISYARLMARINPDSISHQVSNCSESIIKNALPI